MNKTTTAEVPGIAGAIAEIEKRNGVVKHTPGPWESFHQEEYPSKTGGWQVWPSTNAGRARICSLTDGTEAEANARLIAAAPELLEAALGAVAALSQTNTFPADIEAAKSFLNAAIGKAEDR